MKRVVYATIILAITIRPNLVGAAELFGIEVTYSGGTIRQSASSLPDLI